MVPYARIEKLRQAAAARWDATWGTEPPTQASQTAGLPNCLDISAPPIRANANGNRDHRPQPSPTLHSAALDSGAGETSHKLAGTQGRAGSALETTQIDATPLRYRAPEPTEPWSDRWTRPVRPVSVTKTSVSDLQSHLVSTNTSSSPIKRSPGQHQCRRLSGRLDWNRSETSPLSSRKADESSATFIEQWLALEFTSERENEGDASASLSGMPTPRHQSPIKWIQEGVTLMQALEQEEQRQLAAMLHAIEQLARQLSQKQNTDVFAKAPTEDVSSNTCSVDDRALRVKEERTAKRDVPSSRTPTASEDVGKATTASGSVGPPADTPKPFHALGKQAAWQGTYQGAKSSENSGSKETTVQPQWPEGSAAPGATRSFSLWKDGSSMSAAVPDADKSTDMRSEPLETSTTGDLRTQSEPLPADAQQVLDHFLEMLVRSEQFQKDPQSTGPRLQLRKRINLAVNQIGLSLSSVRQKSSLLSALLQQGSTGPFSASSLSAWLHIHIAERIVAEGAEQVVLSLPSSFALGAVLVLITQATPSMKRIVLGAFYRQCPYTIPQWYRREPDETAEHFRARLGYRKPDESRERYSERMGGYVSLFAAMCQTAMPNAPPNPFGLDLLWTWMARMINAKPRPLTALILANALEVAGYAMNQRYGSQFQKLLRLVLAELVPSLPQQAPPGPTARLVLWIENALTRGPAPCPGHELPIQDSQNL